MPRGGPRPGAGRPRGSTRPRSAIWHLRVPAAVDAEVRAALLEDEGLSSFVREAALKEARRRKT